MSLEARIESEDAGAMQMNGVRLNAKGKFAISSLIFFSGLVALFITLIVNSALDGTDHDLLVRLLDLCPEPILSFMCATVVLLGPLGDICCYYCGVGHTCG